jgi:amino acid transporter
MNRSTTAIRTNRSISGLKPDCLGFWEVLGQSIANIAPSATPALVIPLVFATAGNGTWLAYLFGTIAIVFVAASLNQFTKRSASPGSLYAFIARGLGSGAGVVTGWALVLAYLLTGSAVLCGFANYADVLLKYGHIDIPTPILLVVGIVAAWFVSYRDIKLSARLMLLLEGISLTLITILAAIVLVENRFHIDWAQLRLTGVHASSIRIGLVLAFFSFVGFESAAALGDEARKPLHNIPRALLISAATIGVFFVVLSYTEVAGFLHSSTPLNEAQAPLSDLATFAGASYFGPLISFGALVSFWACTLACINAGSRILFSMGRHNVFPGGVGAAHRSHETPHVAVTLVAVPLAAVPLILVLTHPAGWAIGEGGLFAIYGWVGTIATFGFLFAYMLVAIAAPFYLRRSDELKARHVLLAAATVGILAIPIVGSVYPLPAAPYGYFPFIFVGWLAIGLVWYLYRRLSSNMVADISGDLDRVHARFVDGGEVKPVAEPAA